jgi:predicted O-linked N-acetylglucosamine transferase (SPINDLY family)
MSDAETLFRDGQTHHRDGRLEAAEGLFRRVLDVLPEHADALHMLGVLASQRGDQDDALVRFEQAAALRPRDGRILNNLGTAYRAVGRPAEAESCYRKALDCNPDSLRARVNLANTLAARGDPDGALQEYRAALAQAPDDAGLRNNYGSALRLAGDFAAAGAVYRALVKDQPDNATAHNNLGVVCMELGRPEEAAHSYRRALEIEPNHLEAQNNLGNALKELGHLDDALAAFDRALSLNPDHTDAKYNRSLAQAARGDEEIGRFEEALGSFDSARMRLPQFADAHYNRSLVLAARGNTEGALAGLERALALRGDNRFWMVRAGLLPVIGRSAEHLRSWRDRFMTEIGDLISRGIRLPITAIDALMMNFYLAYQGDNDREAMALLSRFYRQACPELCWTAPHCEAGVPARGDGRLRVGFFSTYFKEHAVCWTIRDLPRALPPDRFERSVITTVGPADIDQVLVESVDRTEHVPKDFITVRRRIAEMELDVLVYADIGMNPLSYCLAHGRLARVQCATWGHPVTTGIPTVDYYLSSDAAEPPGAAAHYTENLVRLDGVQTSYRFPTVPDHVRGRAALGLPVEGTLYVCPQSLFKLHPSMDKPLAAILRGDPDGRLVVFHGKDESLCKLLSGRWRASLGELFEQVCFLPRMAFGEFMEVLCSADVLLDSFPFGGGNTSYQGFAAGVPIVTLAGEYLRGRGGLAHYRLMGIEGCVAASVEEYADIALRLGTDKAYRARIAALIRDRRGVLFDDKRVVEHLAQILQEIAR